VVEQLVILELPRTNRHFVEEDMDQESSKILALVDKHTATNSCSAVDMCCEVNKQWVVETHWVAELNGTEEEHHRIACAGLLNASETAKLLISNR
jgi:hypothetical protein